jgi:hypothetical protein
VRHRDEGTRRPAELPGDDLAVGVGHGGVHRRSLRQGVSGPRTTPSRAPP